MRKLLLLFILSLCWGTNSFAQWTSNPAVNTRVTEVGKSDYGREVVTTDEGITYVVTITPEGYGDDDKFYMSHRLQIIDKDGYKMFPEEGLVLCTERNKTYTVTNQLLLVDKDGNAIVMAHDCRNSPSSYDYQGYTVYKVATDGTILWSTDLADGEAFYGSASISAVQTTDGGYVFAYSVYGSNTMMYLRAEKLNSNGEKAWDEPYILSSTSKYYSYPYLVDAGFNEVMMIYVEGDSNVYAHMIEFDGSSVWSKDVTVHNSGGFGSTPAWTFIEVTPAPDGGAFVAWRDGRNNDASYTGYLSYITWGGSSGFSGVTDGLKISYADEYSRMTPHIYYDENEKCIYAVYRQFNQAQQDQCGIYMQKISLEGEILWDAEGLPVVAIQDEVHVDYCSIQGAGDGNVAVFYQLSRGTGDVDSYVMKYDKDGNALWDEAINFSTCVSEKSDLISSPLIDDSYWIACWYDYRDYDSLEKSVEYAQLVNIDGTLGDGSDVPTEHELTFEPEDGKELQSLSQFTVTCEDGLGFNEIGDITLTRDNEEIDVYVLAWEIENGTSATFEFYADEWGETEPLTYKEAGTYVITIPMNYFTLGEKDASEEIVLTYVVDGSLDIGTFVCMVDPESGSDVAELYDNVTFYNPTEGGAIYVNDYCAEVIEVYSEDETFVTRQAQFYTEFGPDGEDYSQTVYFEDRVSEEGTYYVNVPAELFIIYDEEGKTCYNEAMTLTYYLTGTLTGINGISISDENVEGIYSTSGQKLNTTVQGVDIIRYNDGTTKKILIK